MISLEGLTLVTGRDVEAAYILRTFAHYVHDGLIPNMFPEGRQEALYHTADATLWFFHAITRYVRATGDHLTLATLYPTLKDIIAHHLRGTRFGIHVDDDGLLTQGAAGYQLTWMDAKVDDWVVTPRRGKAVEINALWYNALKLMEEWANDLDDEPSAYRDTPRAPATRSTGASGSPKDATCMTSSMPKPATPTASTTMRNAGRIRCSRFRWITPCSTRVAGRRSCTPFTTGS
jgi:predicted glycogen debranching enzyme